MSLLKGVYVAQKKDGTIYYRSSITYCNKHISLGSFSTELDANKAYLEANSILTDSMYTIDRYKKCSPTLTFLKWVILVNFRDNKVYFKTPIYLLPKYFLYYFDQKNIFKFDKDDLFYYSNHKIQKRNGYLFVSDYGMQTNILSRYGIHNFSVEGKDYVFKNGDNRDFRYSNIDIINKYYGVRKVCHKGRINYLSTININGSFIIGKYASEEIAAVAYNKAIDYLTEKGLEKNYTKNYILSLTEIEYAKLYASIRISPNIRKLV